MSSLGRSHADVNEIHLALEAVCCVCHLRPEKGKLRKLVLIKVTAKQR